jgi:serine/threonine protein kinase
MHTIDDPANIMSLVSKEIQKLSKLDNPFVIKPFGCYDYNLCLYSILECCTGKDLLAQTAIKTFNESETKRVAYQLLYALSYLNYQGIVHRDIKPDNMMYLNSETDSPIKLLDFGLSFEYGPTDAAEIPTSKIYGSDAFAARDYYCGSFSTKSDVFSAGIVLYFLITGKTIFSGNQLEMVTIYNYTNAVIKYNLPEFGQISKEGIEFIKSLLQYDTNARPHAQKALKHEWLRNVIPYEKEAIRAMILRVAEYRGYGNPLIHLVKLVMVRFLEYKLLKKYIDAFISVDNDKNGVITQQDIDCTYERLGMIPQEFDFSKYRRANNVITYTDFLVSSLNPMIFHDCELIRKAYYYIASSNETAIGQVLIDHCAEKMSFCYKFNTKQLYTLEDVIMQVVRSNPYEL